MVYFRNCNVGFETLCGFETKCIALGENHSWFHAFVIFDAFIWECVEHFNRGAAWTGVKCYKIDAFKLLKKKSQTVELL